jgi:hypothetical protein
VPINRCPSIGAKHLFILGADSSDFEIFVWAILIHSCPSIGAKHLFILGADSSDFGIFVWAILIGSFWVWRFDTDGAAQASAKKSMGRPHFLHQLPRQCSDRPISLVI